MVTKYNSGKDFKMRKRTLIVCKQAEFSKNQIVYFRKKFNAQNGDLLKVNVFADARYKLYLNGHFADAGPAKGNDKELFYNEVDLSRFVVTGENEIEVRVLNLSAYADVDKQLCINSLIRTGKAILELWGELNGEEFISDSSWECAVQKGVEFFEPEYAGYAGIPEYINSVEYKDIKWEKAVEIDKLPVHINACGNTTPWHHDKSPIPLMRLDKKKIDMSENEVFDFGYLTTAYLKIACSGKGKIKFTYAERYKNDKNDDRADKSGKIIGDYDIIDIDGDLVFEPFWFRCFRFIKIETEGDVSVKEAYAYETGYPLKVKNNYDFGDETDNKLWEISVRTLERCMQDTFTDCPYYEQLQYAMDTYLQCIYAYQISSDDRLQRRAIKDFALSISEEGLAQSRTPSVRKQFIPGFSLFYVMMVLEHFERFKDKEIFEKNIPYILQVFNWYKRQSDEKGLVTLSDYWHFIDWAKDYLPWGVPKYEENATSGIESLMLSYTLRRFSRNLRNTDYAPLAEKFESMAQKINNAANEVYFSDEVGAYSTTENKKIFGQHMQIWAVLSGCATGEKAKNIMKKSFEFKGTQVTFAYAYFLFRALEKTGLYEMRDSLMNELRNFVKLNCTTVPEDPFRGRSECHAWSAGVLYEFTAMDLGVKQQGNKIVINPYTKDRKSAKGTVFTALGEIYVSWEKKNGEVFVEYSTSENIPVEVIKEF